MVDEKLKTPVGAPSGKKGLLERFEGLETMDKVLVLFGITFVLVVAACMCIFIAVMGSLISIPSYTNTYATSTPTTAPLMGPGFSMDNPVPVGTPIQYTSEKYEAPYTATVTIEQVWRGDDAYKIINNFNSYNGRLTDPKREYLLIKAKFTLDKFPGYNGIIDGTFSKTFRIDGEDFQPVSDKQYTGGVTVYDLAPTFGAILFEGGSTEGYVALAVYKDDSHPLIEFDDSDFEVGSIESGKTPIWFTV